MFLLGLQPVIQFLAFLEAAMLSVVVGANRDALLSFAFCFPAMIEIRFAGRVLLARNFGVGIGVHQLFAVAFRIHIRPLSVCINRCSYGGRVDLPFEMTVFCEGTDKLRDRLVDLAFFQQKQPRVRLA
jgi:uncharacterized membrane protein YciS (DUF1049 family)